MINQNQDLQDLVRSNGHPRFKTERRYQKNVCFSRQKWIRNQHEPNNHPMPLRTTPIPDTWIFISKSPVPHQILWSDTTAKFDRGTKTKGYSVMTLDILPVCQSTAADDWQGNRVKQLERTTDRRYRTDTYEKPHLSQKTPARYFVRPSPPPWYRIGSSRRDQFSPFYLLSFHSVCPFSWDDCHLSLFFIIFDFRYIRYVTVISPFYCIRNVS